MMHHQRSPGVDSEQGEKTNGRDKWNFFAREHCHFCVSHLQKLHQMSGVLKVSVFNWSNDLMYMHLICASSSTCPAAEYGNTPSLGSWLDCVLMSVSCLFLLQQMLVQMFSFWPMCVYSTEMQDRELPAGQRLISVI